MCNKLRDCVRAGTRQVIAYQEWVDMLNAED